MAHGRAPHKTYRVKLTESERDTFQALVRQGRVPGWKLQRARAMLKCDEGDGGPGWPDVKIAEALEVTTRSLENWRKQAVEQGPLSLLERQKQDRPHLRKLNGASEARLVQLACSTPPEGHGRWSLRMLAGKLVALEVVASISHECVRQVLKKRDQALAS